MLGNLLRDLIDEDLKIFKEEFSFFLPEEIIDFHVHLWGEGQIDRDIPANKSISIGDDKNNFFMNLEFIDKFDYKDFLDFTKTIFPGINYRGLFFGNPLIETGIKKNNEMIGKGIIEKEIDGLFIPKVNDSYQFLERAIIEGKFLGFKPYPNLAIGKNYDNDQDSVSILDFLTEDHIKIADKFGLIIMLHIPKSKRLSDKKNIRDIVDISTSYPNIKLVLAHAGRSYCTCDIVDSIKKISSLKNVYVDTTMINNWEVIEILLEELSSERIIYGSDLPIAALRGKNICVNGKHYFFTYKQYPWSVSSKELDIRDITLFLYEEIRGIKKAIQKTKKDKKVINNIFYQNALNLTDDVKRSFKS